MLGPVMVQGKKSGVEVVGYGVPAYGAKGTLGLVLIYSSREGREFCVHRAHDLVIEDERSRLIRPFTGSRNSFP